MNRAAGFLDSIALVVLYLLASFYNIAKSFLDVVYSILLGRFYKRKFAANLWSYFFYSLPLIFLTSFFTGAVLTIQTFAGLEFLASSSTIGRVVGSSIATELGPVLTGLMMVSRLCSSIAAEVATMNVSDQIDGLRTLSINPKRFLFYPCVAACVIVFPAILIFADVISVLGSYAVATLKYGFNGAIYTTDILQWMSFENVKVGLIKVFLFGLLTPFVSCSIGFRSIKGAKEVGQATIDAVVISSILILVVNYIVTFFFFGMQ